MLEVLLLSLCYGSQLNNDACHSAMDKWKQQNPEYEQGIDKTLNLYDRKYIKTLPTELQLAGVAAGIAYKKELKFGIYDGFIIDLRDMGQWQLGYKWSW